MSEPDDDVDFGTPYPELNRAAGAGLRLVAARHRFRRLSRAVMGGLAAASSSLDAGGYTAGRRPVRLAFEAAHDAYARFVYVTESRWEDEDGYLPAAPGPMSPVTRVDDIRDGRLSPVPEGPEVCKVFQESARREFAVDRPAAQRLLCVALLWSVDLRHESEDPDWSRRQGVFPGAEAAPTLSRLFLELAHRTEAPGSRPAAAFRETAAAVGRIPALARAFGDACCCAYEYDAILAAPAA